MLGLRPFFIGAKKGFRPIEVRTNPFFSEPFLGSSGIKPQGSVSVKEVRQVNMQPYADNFVPVVLVDHPEHTNEKPFCWDQTCPCHDDPDLISEVAIFVDDGLLTLEEAKSFIRGGGI